MRVMTQFAAARDYGRDLRFQAMFEGAAIGVGICQLNGRILEANPALCNMLGYSSDELMGPHAGAVYPTRLSSDSPSDSLSHSSSDSVSSSGDELLDELLSGERRSFEIERQYQRKDGSELWGVLTVSLGRNARRQPAFLIVTLADARERRRVEAHLREAEKMEVIGRLAGGIAHDFNNLLTGILLYCDLLNAGLENDGFKNIELETIELRQHVREVRLAGEQGASLTHQLLAIARKQAAEPRPVALNKIVASTENLLRRLIGEQIQLIVRLDSALDSPLNPTIESAVESAANGGPGLVLADPAQLRQILMNLVLNARDAMTKGGRITLCTRAGEFPAPEFPQPSETLRAPSSQRPRAVSLVVKDEGCGMDAETRARLFEPFFTTKSPGSGTGLGLAMVQRIVAEAGGAIAVQSEPGHGTSIEVFFPAIESHTPACPT
jgi:two-component system, cell cycle sensor histidine kinase and response regulator CckA